MAIDHSRRSPESLGYDRARFGTQHCPVSFIVADSRYLSMLGPAGRCGIRCCFRQQRSLELLCYNMQGLCNEVGKTS
jgi:hypothetical protein